MHLLPGMADVTPGRGQPPAFSQVHAIRREGARATANPSSLQCRRDGEERCPSACAAGALSPGWSLHGLLSFLRRRDHTEEGVPVASRLRGCLRAKCPGGA